MYVCMNDDRSSMIVHFSFISVCSYRYYTGRSEIARICSSSQMHSSEMSYLLSRSFRNSRQLSTYSNVVFSTTGKDFDEKSIVQSIEEIKFPSFTSSHTISSSSSLIVENDPKYREIEIMRANLILCVKGIKFYNEIYRKLMILKSTTFDWTVDGTLYI